MMIQMILKQNLPGFFIAKIRFNEIKKNIWEIVDNKNTKERVKIKALKRLSEITVQLLELSFRRDYVDKKR